MTPEATREEEEEEPNSLPSLSNTIKINIRKEALLYQAFLD